MFRHLKLIARLTASIGGCVLVGCSNSDLAGSQFRDDTGEGASPSDTAVDDGDSGQTVTDTVPQPTWFRLGAQVSLVDGLAAAVSLDLVLYDADQVLIPDCAELREVQGVVVSQDTPDPTVYHWWELLLAPAEVSCLSAGQLPDVLVLGLGALHPEVRAQMLSRGLDDVSGSLYGAYALLAADELALEPAEQRALAYGYAGTPSDRAGETPALDAGPLPDGDYTLSGVFLFPLDPAD